MILVSIVGCASPNPRPRSVTAAATEWSEAGFQGHRLETDHFVLFSTVRDEEFESALPGFLEMTYARCAATIPTSGSLRAKLTTYVFGTRSEWDRFSRRHFPGRADIYSRIRSGGFTEGGMSVSFYVDRSAALATIAHEVWHQYVNAHVSGPIPAWLNEGLACRHESVRAVGRKIIFTPRDNSFRINGLREAIQTNRLIPLDRLIETDAGEVIGVGRSELTQTYYAQAWALVNFLEFGANGRYSAALHRLLSDLADDSFRLRKNAASLAAASAASGSQSAVFEAYFGVPPERIADAYYSELVRVADFGDVR